MEVEWLILADYATIVNGKLYLQGGGWDKLTINSGFPVSHHMGLAASFVIPWNETNQVHELAIEILTEDGHQLGKIEARIEVGRPPGIPQGQDQRAQIAGDMTLKLDKPGTYPIVASVGDEVARRIHFNVVSGPMLQMTQAKESPPGAPSG